MSFSTVPDLCLLIILDRISLRELLSTVKLVCNRWARMLPVVCNRRQLILFDNQNYLKRLSKHNSVLYDTEVLEQVVNDDGTRRKSASLSKFQLEQCALIVPELSEQACEQLVMFFPHLSSLQFGQSVDCWPTVIQRVNNLLKKWSTKLVHCSLWLYNQHKTDQETINGYSSTLLDSLLDHLNQLTSIKQLTLQIELPSSPHDFAVTRVVNCPPTTQLYDQLLSRLEQFEFQEPSGWLDRHMYGEIELALQQPNCSLKRILHGPDMPIESCATFSDCLASKLFNYRLEPEIENHWSTDVFSILSRLTSLDCLSLDCQFQNFSLTLPELISRLSHHLTQLTLMKLTCVPESFFKHPVKFRTKMESIKALHFVIHHPLTHKYIANLSLPRTFPNVQIIKFHQIVCRYEYDDAVHQTTKRACLECPYLLKDVRAPNDQDLIRECSKLSVKSLKKCPTECRIIFKRTYHTTSSYTGASNCSNFKMVCTADKI